MRYSKKKGSPNSYDKGWANRRVMSKCAEIVGMPPVGPNGLPSFLNLSWPSDSAREGFINWLVGALREDKEFYQDLSGREHNTQNACRQLALWWDSTYGPRDAR